ncbi:GFA family protein [Parasphingorhabdus litoris]|uniref:GFA family protein n=1 Tax=Parasphingorhabdus litoris TaxID=394733 RepID=A0ABP3KGY1_9SPHN|nr:GFA family protein [Parasphingorhabdus litoris]
MLKGGCNCGAVSFEIEMDLKDVYICHCSICRKWTGNNGVAVSIVPNEKFRWSAGQEQIACWEKPDADWQSWFCRNCGSALPGRNDERNMFIPVGLLDARVDNLKVAHHIWVESKASWDEITDNGKQHKRAFQV